MSNDGRDAPGRSTASRRITQVLRPTPRGPMSVAQPVFGTPPPRSRPTIAPTPTIPPSLSGAPDLSGRTLGNWRLIRKLGEGSFGVVYEGQNAAIAGRLAAVKVLHPHMSLQPEIKRRFINEASAASRAEHENIVQVFDGGITEDHICFVVMELLKGTTLRDVLKQGRLAPGRALRVAWQTARALQAAHRENIVHRDLKPDNIFLCQRSDGPEYAKVLDFGIAKLAADAIVDNMQTRPGMWLGTPAYMSPEQWQTLPDVDRRADIYALGCILYEMLAGEPPFKGPTQFMVMMGHLNDVPTAIEHLCPGLPPSLPRLVEKMLAKRRTDRPQSMLEVIDALGAIADELQVFADRELAVLRDPDPLEGKNVTARDLAPPPPTGKHAVLSPVRRPPPEGAPELIASMGRPRSRPIHLVDTFSADELRRILESDPYRVDLYRALYQGWVDRGRVDEAWCAASVLSFLQRAAPEETALFEKHRRPPIDNVADIAPFGDGAWERLIMHPDEDATVGALLAAMSHPAALLRAATYRQYGLKRSGRMELSSSQSPFSRLFLAANHLLQPIVPEVHVRPEQSGGIRIANCRDGGLLVPSLLIGNDVLADDRAPEIAFRLGKLLTMFRPERYLKLIYPTTQELRLVFIGGLKLAQPQLVVAGAETQQIMQYANRMGVSLVGPIRELLAKAARGLPRTGVEIYLAKWAQAVEITAHRVGFILSNDLAVSARFIENEPSHGTGLQSADKIGELLRYVVSDGYFQVRRQLGIAAA